MCKEIKEATAKMLRNISGEMNKVKRTSDKEIAEMLGISKTVYSNLLNKKSMPGIILWYKIICLHREKVNNKETNQIIENVNTV